LKKRFLKSSERDLIIVSQGGKASGQGTWIHEELILKLTS